jgi:iron complex transport system substrate-binding protein
MISTGLIIIVLVLISSGCTAYLQEIPDIKAEGSPSGSPIRITDSAGETHTFSHPVQRIVVLNTGAAEMLVDIGAGDTIVGAADNIFSADRSFMKPFISGAANLGPFMTPDIEAIISLHPDVVITYANSKPVNLDQMLAANITVVKMTCYKPREVAGDARTLGKLTGHEEGAERYARFVERNLDLLDERLEGISESEKPRALYEWTTAYKVFGPASSGGDLISLAGAKNVADNLSGLQVIVSAEWVLEQDPEIIFKDGSSGSGNFSLVRKELLDRPGFQPLRAIRDERVYCVSPHLASTPRSVIGALYAAKALYPDRFSDIDPDEILREYAREFLPGTDQIQTFYPPLTSVSPNFTNATAPG